jgi:hypothetical protein
MLSVAVVGRGDGMTKLTTVAYYTLDLSGRIGALAFSTCTFLSPGAREQVTDAPLPEVTWFAEATIAILIAIASNTLVKSSIAAAIGGGALGRRAFVVGGLTIVGAAIGAATTLALV